MARPFFAATLLLAAPLAASAQETAATLWPLAPGNTWTYVPTNGWDGRDGGGTSEVGRAFRWTALDSVDVGAGAGTERLPRIRVDDGVAVAECLVRTNAQPDIPAAGFSLFNATGTAPCQAPPGTLPVNGGATPGVSVYLGGTVSRDVVVGGEALGSRLIRHGMDDNGGTNPRTDYGWDLLNGLGLLTFGRSTSGGGSYSYHDVVLRQATVGGQTVGQPLGSRADFWPLAVGNRWEFQLTDRVGASEGEVVWTVEAAGALRLRRIQNGAVTADVTCPLARVDVSAETGWQTRFALGGCTLPDPLLAPSLQYQTVTLAVDVQALGQTIAIGGQTVVADAASGQSRISGGPTYNSRIADYTLARGIGPVRYSIRPGGPGVELRWDARLAFARVGGATYGQQVVADETGPSPLALALTAGPNPTHGALALAFTLPAPAEASVEIVDALGRTVLRQGLGAQPAGAGTARVDLSGLAAGVYSVRLTAGASQASARVSVVR